MKVAFVTGACTPHDAISDAVRDQMRWCREAGHDTRLFAHGCDTPDLPYTRIATETDLLFDPFLETCDVILFHFGVFYPAFTALPALPRRVRRLVVFHNVTPKALVPPEAHPLIEQSLVQMAAIVFADQVICDSAFNRDTLRAAGVGVPAVVLPLAVSEALRPPVTKPSFDDGLARIAYVGRLVASKGPTDLLDAIERVLDGPTTRLRLDIICNTTFSDPAVVMTVAGQIDRLRASHGADVDLQLRGHTSDAEKARILADSDLFVLPTYHEGFCVPIVEALASGCRVITYDNSNTPFVSGGLAALVPTGDRDALAAALAAELECIGSAGWKGQGYQAYLAQAAAHLAAFERNSIRRRFLSLVEGVRTG